MINTAETAHPLGAHWDGHGIHFALFSEHAEKVELCLFDPETQQEIERIDMVVSDSVWRVYVDNYGIGTLYGYRVHGAYDPENGLRFNANKLLVDPYAKQLNQAIEWNDSVYGFDRHDSLNEFSMSQTDSASYMPKSVVVDETFDWGDDKPPKTPWSHTVIYETHVAGFTKLNTLIDEPLRGRFLGLASDQVIDYLKSLGITAIELLPIHSFPNDHFLVEKDLVNYWGYNTLSFFAVESRYLMNGDRNEFKAMVKKLHEAGIEVILDVVYNHTAEGDQNGATLCYRGIDNQSYYRLPDDNKHHYINDSGCGNSLNINHPFVLKMVIDSLRYWVEVMHVDGFRFDLAVSLGREAEGFDKEGQFFKSIESDDLLSQIKLIAEPWDLGPGGYQLGGFPNPWVEWNDRFRDTMRRFWKGEPGLLPDLASCLHGSSDFFEHNKRKPSASLNFITSHDGFTLNDLVSYNERHNWANGEDNQDGHGANFSDNNGVEGPSDNLLINARRERQQKNLLATLFFAHGTPMLLAGDEQSRSQQGNNNAYCQDNDITWQQWSVRPKDTTMYRCVQEIIKLRRDHPILKRNRYVHGDEQFEPIGFTDIEWLGVDGKEMQEMHWHDNNQHFLAMLQACEPRKKKSHGQQSTQPRGSDRTETLLIIFNADDKEVNFVMPKSEFEWQCIFSTADSKPGLSLGRVLKVESHCVHVFELMIQQNQ